MSSQLAEISVIESQIETIKDSKTALLALSTINNLYSLLQAAKRFNELACKYCQLEAATYVRIVELGLAHEIPTNGYKRTAALWLAELSEDERSEVINECGREGMTLQAYWVNIVHEKDMTAKAIKEFKQHGGYAIAHFKECGEVNLNEVFSSIRKSTLERVPSDFQKGYIDIVRNAIRRQGGHAIGDGEGTYVTKEKAAEKLADIVSVKVDSISHDLDRLRQVIDDVDITEAYVDLERVSNFSDELTTKSYVGLLFVMAGLAKPCWHTQNDVYRAKLIADIVKRIGETPTSLVNTLMHYSEQVNPHYSEYYGIDMDEYGGIPVVKKEKRLPKGTDPELAAVEALEEILAEEGAK